MTDLREFVCSGRPASELVAAFAGAGIVVADDRAGSQRLRRTWLDTFDRRMHRAGLELEQIELGGTTSIELRADGRTLRVSGGIEYPALAAALPAGPLRTRVAATTGIRALQQTGRYTGRRRTLRVLNADAKTVARVHVDESGGTARIAVVTLRGYEGQAARVAAVVASIDGIAAAPGTSYECSLTAPGGRVRLPRTELDPGMPAGAGVAAVMGAFLATVEANVEGVVADIDTEFLHDLRVAVRKARSLLKLAGDVVPADVSQLAAELRWLGDATTPVRDLDVYVLGLPAMAARLRAADRGDLDTFAAHLAQRRAAAFDQLVADLRSARFRRLRASWRTIAERTDATSAGSLTVSELAADRLSRAHGRMVKRGSRITTESPAEDLHSLRKRGKEYRYLLEAFQAVESPRARKRVEPVLKALQECLGEFQDSEVQAAAIRTFAGEMMHSGASPPATLLAMGELSAQLDADQRDARAAYPGLFDSFITATGTLRWTTNGRHG